MLSFFIMTMFHNWHMTFLKNLIGNFHVPGASVVALPAMNLPAMQETQVQPLTREDPLEKGIDTHSSILAQRISLTDEPGRLQSMRSQRVRHD